MTRILLSTPDVTELEAEYMLGALRSGWVAPLGPEVEAFEAEVAARVGVAHALALSSGTAALHLALLSVGASPGRVVVEPTMTFAASANAVAYTGATPVFVDSQADANVDPTLLLSVVDRLRGEGADIAAVMTVDLFGRSADYDEILPALAERQIPLIEDAAEAVGAEYHGRAAGSFGAAAALSFNGNKIMTTSGGGMLLSDSAEMIARCRYLATQARQPVAHYEHTEIGYNYRLSNLLAALGRAQLCRLDAMIARRRAIRDFYAAELAEVAGIRFLGRETDRGDTEDNCWLAGIVLDPQLTGMDADLVVKVLEGKDIEARHLWKPMHLQPVFAEARAFVTGTSEALFRSGVTLPSGSALSDADVERVAGELRTLLETGR